MDKGVHEFNYVPYSEFKFKDDQAAEEYLETALDTKWRVIEYILKNILKKTD
ncbi:MAG: hypothetical protein K0Q87_5421 [Neobacillus sp.]|jgi:hypothetical protein|nr:hypothetical protein [Neobacillus sp.]